jgi:hypothetical protein
LIGTSLELSIELVIIACRYMQYICLYIVV